MQGSSLIQIIVNGEPKELNGGSSVEAMLTNLALDRCKVAVERNGAIVPRSRHGEVTLEAGDRVEIVHFIGGG